MQRYGMDFHAYFIYNTSMKVGAFMKSITDIIDPSGMLLTRDAMMHGIEKHAFYRFIIDHQFEKVSHGVYLSPEAWEDSAFVLHLKESAEYRMQRSGTPPPVKWAADCI